MDNEEKKELLKQGELRAYNAILGWIRGDIQDIEGYLECLGAHSSARNVTISKEFEEGKLAMLYKLGFCLQGKIMQANISDADVAKKLREMVGVK